MEVRDISMAAISVPSGWRPTKPAAVRALADSILEIGLQHAVGLVSDGKHYKLVHGRHRYEAFRLLGRPQIPATVLDADSLHIELAHIDENIIRAGLTKLEEARALKRRKEIYLALHPETAKGKAGAIASNKVQGKGNAKENVSVASFAEDTATKTGRTARSVRGQVALAEKLPESVQEAIADSPVADNQSELKALAKLEPKQQAKAAEAIAAGAESVSEALTGKKKQRRQRQSKAISPCPRGGKHVPSNKTDDCPECHEPGVKHEKTTLKDLREAILEAVGVALAEGAEKSVVVAMLRDIAEDL